jgi:IrrE N-terminal-like domain
LGHHVFGHGGKIDALLDETVQSASRDEDEILVDAFAGAFLIPVAGVLAEFAKRNWTIANASTLQFFTISSVYGVGYQTLVSHCRLNHLINETQAQSLSKLTPAKILSQIVGAGVKSSFFKIIDEHTAASTIDLETSNYLFLPATTLIEGDNLKQCQHTTVGTGYIAQKPGIVRAAALDNSKSCFIRIQNQGYVGLAENRHLENK